jgi:hypothetical protein
MREVLGQISHIFHIAQMLIVLQMRHINLLSISRDLAHVGFLSLLAPVGFYYEKVALTSLSILNESIPSLKG